MNELNQKIRKEITCEVVDDINLRLKIPFKNARHLSDIIFLTQPTFWHSPSFYAFQQF